MKTQHLYVHVPFCDSICAYCDFERCGNHPMLRKKWLERIIEDIQKLDEDYKTCYIGGGTPSCLTADELDSLLHALLPLCKNSVEWTIETNPENLTDEKIRVLQNYPVNRISLGVQSLQDECLKFIHRKHTSKDVFRVLDKIHNANIRHLSVDLIYGLPNQTLDQWIEDLHRIAQHPAIDHISIYSLTIEPHSAFGRKGVSSCDEELEASMYEAACDILKKCGYKHYEVSNFAKQNGESLHNQAYWKFKDFKGLGCGAYGMEKGIYYHIPFKLHQYIDGTLEIEKEILSEKDQAFEAIMMGLRMLQGICLNEYQQRFTEKWYNKARSVIDSYISTNHLELEEGYLRCTEKGLEILNTILVDIMEVFENE